MSQLNAANQRTKRTDADNSYWDYAYDSLGQVTNAVRRWTDGTLVAGQQYGYQFDDIGNRQRSEVSGQRSDYTANLLNQYTQRTVPGVVNILGSAASNATVTVNGATATRQGEYFHSELALANTNAAAYSSIAITASMTSGTNNVTVTNTGHAFLPKTPEQFTHDADGNLISDGRWQYTWDAENRLIAIETLPNLPTNVPVQKLMFQYDAQSRRISKVVSNFNGSAWSETSNLRFVYDGWNLLAEVGTTGSVVRSYCWGLDLSGTEQGAGGIAGLLFGTFNGSSSTSSVAYAFDGNGNVSALLDMRTGQLAAEYEYGPFGETIRATGPLASANPFGFSTKYRDAETGLLYYGYRYYQPVTGRWVSRDPIEEKGGMNLFGFAANQPVSQTDALGLWYNGDGGMVAQHTQLTEGAFNDAFPANTIPQQLRPCAQRILRWLVWANINQDRGTAKEDNRRHFNRAIDTPVGSGVAAAIQAYTDYLSAEGNLFQNALARSNQKNCRYALFATGRLSHSWQDYYAHAVIVRRANDANKILWTATPAITGSPDAPTGTTGTVAPSSWNGISEPGEHRWGEVDGAEGTARQVAARRYVAGRFQTLLKEWYTKCRCCCDELGEP